MILKHLTLFLALLPALALLNGCAGKTTGISSTSAPISQHRVEPPGAEPAHPLKSTPPIKGWTVRTVSEQELIDLEKLDPELTFDACREILCRLNVKARYYILDYVREGLPLKAPNDFRAYKNWTPLPAHIPQIERFPKFILVIKNHPFLGWYENGRLVEDTYACLGNSSQPTLTGLYRVEEKDDDHYSRSYTNDYGEPAWMPWALRIYEVVWIHAGDVADEQCSHGCVILSVKKAEDLFKWADLYTPVVVADSPEDLHKFIGKAGKAGS